MLEINRVRAIEEIREKLNEREVLIQLIRKLNSLAKEEKWSEYLDFIIENQSFLMKYPDYLNKNSINMVGLHGNSIIPEYDSILAETFKKYADDTNPIYFYPTFIGGGYQSPKIFGYESLENEDIKMTIEDYKNNSIDKEYMTIELLNPNSENYYTYRTWLYRLLLENSTEAAFEILKRVAECDNKVYNKEIHDYDKPYTRILKKDN